LLLLLLFAGPAHGDGWVVVLQTALAASPSIDAQRLGRPVWDVLCAAPAGVRLSGWAGSNRTNGIWVDHNRDDGLGRKRLWRCGDQSTGWNLVGENPMHLGHETISSHAVVQHFSGGKIRRWHRAEGAHNRSVVRRMFLADHLSETNGRVNLDKVTR